MGGSFALVVIFSSMESVNIVYLLRGALWFPTGLFYGSYKESFLPHFIVRRLVGLDGPLRGTLIGLGDLSESDFSQSKYICYTELTIKPNWNTNALCGIYIHTYLIFTECREKTKHKTMRTAPCSWHRTNSNELWISLKNKDYQNIENETKASKKWW